MSHPYIISMIEKQSELEKYVENLDKVIQCEFSELSAEAKNHLILARAGLTHDLEFLNQMIEKTHTEINKGTLTDPSFEAILKVVD